MLSRELEASLNAVAQEASTKRHEFVTVEHLLLALTNNEEAISVLKQVLTKFSLCSSNVIVRETREFDFTLRFQLLERAFG